MRVKKYRAHTMPEAMAIIRADLGPEAVILHSGQIRAPGWLGFVRPPELEVVAAVEPDLRDFPQPTPAADETIQRMQQELAALKTALYQVTEMKQRSESNPMGHSRNGLSSLDDWYKQLLDQGVMDYLAQEIIQRAADGLNRWALDNQDVMHEHLRWHLGRRLPLTQLTFTPGQPSIFFLVGPTGVGKTTTIAKLAASFSQPRLGQSKGLQSGGVLIITTDTFRVAAIPQIKTLGDILSIPVEVAYTPEQLKTIISQNRHYSLILVDTPGRSQHAATDILELNRYLAVVSNKTVHLTMTANTKYEDMQEIVEAFSSMAVTGVVLTKLDETRSLGAAYTLACETGLPLSYFTTGQRVPEDVEVATAEHLVSLLVGSVLKKSGGSATGLPHPRRSQLSPTCWENMK